MLDIMPSRGLIIHEYRKHGTCSGLSPEAYFDTARTLFSTLKIPERFRNPTAAQFLDPREVVDAFTAANPRLDADMLAVGCGGRDDRLREVRICFSKSGEPRSCGANEAQRKLCRSSRMHVPPVR
jgi:ribonuclease T2